MAIDGGGSLAAFDRYLHPELEHGPILFLSETEEDAYLQKAESIVESQNRDDWRILTIAADGVQAVIDLGTADLIRSRTGYGEDVLTVNWNEMLNGWVGDSYPPPTVSQRFFADLLSAVQDAEYNVEAIVLPSSKSNSRIMLVMQAFDENDWPQLLSVIAADKLKEIP